MQTVTIYCTSPEDLRRWLDTGEASALIFTGAPSMEDYGWIRVGEMTGECTMLPEQEIAAAGVSACRKAMGEINAAAGEKLNQYTNLLHSFLQIGYAGEASQSSTPSASERT